jgi:putative FmdB family regulatory protein
VPIYGYRCTNCGHQFEIQQRMSDDPLQVCPKCQGKLTKVLYPTGVIFKGSGFYTTDYKASGKASENGSSQAPDGKPETKAEPKPKPESKSESSD